MRQRLVQNPEWNPQPKDRRRLSELIERWSVPHGHALSDGENRKRLLLQLAEDMGEPVAAQLTGNQYTEYRTGYRGAWQDVEQPPGVSASGVQRAAPVGRDRLHESTATGELADGLLLFGRIAALQQSGHARDCRPDFGRRVVDGLSDVLVNGRTSGADE